MKKLLIGFLLSVPSMYASVPSVGTQAQVAGQTGIVVIGSGGSTTNVGTPNQTEFSPNVYPGGIDFNFGDPATPGFVRTPLEPNSSYYAMVKDANNKLVVCGYGNNGGAKAWVVARYTSAGVLDTTFGSGLGYVQENGIGVSEARNLVIDSAGNILVTGYSTPSTTKAWTTIRYTSTGARDTTFNTTGMVQETDLGVSEAYSVSISTLTATPYIIYTGGYTTPSSVRVITTISYLSANGARNPSYNP